MPRKAKKTLQPHDGVSHNEAVRLACPHFPHTKNTQLAAVVAVGK